MYMYKSKCTFLQFDIEEFYPSISKDLLLKSLTFAEEFINIQENDKNVILHARKSLLFTNDDYWLKKAETLILMLPWEASMEQNFVN